MAENSEVGTPARRLTGTEESKVDDRYRVSVPKKYRDLLGTSFAICIGLNGRVWIVRNAAWEQMASEIDAMDPLNPGRHQLEQMLYGNAEADVQLDDGGRIVLPKALRPRFVQGKEVKFVGCGDRLELWSEGEYYGEHSEMLTQPNTWSKAFNEAYSVAKGSKGS